MSCGCSCPHSPEEGARSPEVTGGCEPLDMGPGNPTQVLSLIIPNTCSSLGSGKHLNVSDRGVCQFWTSHVNENLQYMWPLLGLSIAFKGSPTMQCILIFHLFYSPILFHRVDTQHATLWLPAEQLFLVWGCAACCRCGHCYLWSHHLSRVSPGVAESRGDHVETLEGLPAALSSQLCGFTPSIFYPCVMAPHPAKG